MAVPGVYSNQTIMNLTEEYDGDISLYPFDENSTESPAQNFTNSAGIFEYPEPYNTLRIAVNWATVGLVLMSLTGNTMVIIVMTRKRNRKSTTCFLFTCLAVSDMCLAISVPFERWLHWTCGISLYGISPYITTAKTTWTYSNIQISSWLLVCITVERVLSIAMPLQIKNICTKSREGIVIFVLCFVIIGLNIVSFNFIVVVTFHESFGIILVPKVDHGLAIIAWMDFAVSFAGPIAIIIIGSTYIFIHLLRIKIQKTDTKSNRNKSVTVTLLAANVVFVVTMSPFVLLYLVYPHMPSDAVSPYLIWTLYEYFLFLSDLNSALNFFVYVLSGTRFRSDVKKLLGMDRLKKVSSSITTTLKIKDNKVVSGTSVSSVTS